MSARVSWEGAALLAPVPACMITCAEGGARNVMTAAWTGIVCTRPPATYISVRPERYSHGIIERSGVFVINLVSASLVRAADWCGVKSGREVDKFSALALETELSPKLGLPMLSLSPVCIECRVREKLGLGSHDMFLADIVGVSALASLVDGSGALRLERANLAAYAHGEYYALGDKLGSFGFSVRKNAKNKRGN